MLSWIDNLSASLLLFSDLTVDSLLYYRYVLRICNIFLFLGEDRWLCTLLLQQGYRIDYSACADALTYAPESFAEFFNQRRRWSPSTLANIMDLLGSWRTTTRLNDNISRLYMLYQVLYQHQSPVHTLPGILSRSFACTCSIRYSIKIFRLYLLYQVFYQDLSPVPALLGTLSTLVACTCSTRYSIKIFRLYLLY